MTMKKSGSTAAIASTDWRTPVIWLLYTVTPYLLCVYLDSRMAWLMHCVASFLGDWILSGTGLNTPFGLMASVYGKLYGRPAKRNAFLVKIMVAILSLVITFGAGFSILCQAGLLQNPIVLSKGRMPASDFFDANHATRPIRDFNQLVSSWNESQAILLSFDELEGALERFEGPVIASDMQNKNAMLMAIGKADKAAVRVESSFRGTLERLRSTSYSVSGVYDNILDLGTVHNSLWTRRQQEYCLSIYYKVLEILDRDLEEWLTEIDLYIIEVENLKIAMKELNSLVWKEVGLAKLAIRDSETYSISLVSHEGWVDWALSMGSSSGLYAKGLKLSLEDMVNSLNAGGDVIRALRSRTISVMQGARVQRKNLEKIKSPESVDASKVMQLYLSMVPQIRDTKRIMLGLEGYRTFLDGHGETEKDDKKG